MHNRIQLEESIDQNVFTLFSRQAAASSDKIAVIAEGESVTYAELRP